MRSIHWQWQSFLNDIGHGKAQYIVKAILAYQNLLQSGEIVQIPNTITEETAADKEEALEELNDEMLSGIIESLSMFQAL